MGFIAFKKRKLRMLPHPVYDIVVSTQSVQDQ